MHEFNKFIFGGNHSDSDGFIDVVYLTHVVVGKVFVFLLDDSSFRFLFPLVVL